MPEPAAVPIPSDINGGEVDVKSGTMALDEQPSTTASNVSVKLGGNVMNVAGTNVLCQQNGQTSRVAVVSGAVTISNKHGTVARLRADQQISLPGGKPVKYDPNSWDSRGIVLAGMPPLSSVAPELSSRQLYGTIAPRVNSNGLPADWLWQDPGANAKLSGVDARTLRVTVPDGNDLWGNGAGTSAPRLLHKVTGDFSLQSQVNLACKCTNLATAEFLLYAPGSSPGYLAKQMDAYGIAAQYQILGGGWVHEQGLDILSALHSTQLSDNPKAPDKPVWLRLTRNGDLWRTYLSMDGKTWTLTTRQEIVVPDTVWVGWVFKRVAGDGLAKVQATTTLQSLSLTTMPRGTLLDATWDVPQSPATSPSVGTVTTSGDQVHVALSSKPLGTIEAYRNGVLTGDFDVSVWLKVQRWTQKPGQTHRAWLAVEDIDGKNYAYVGLFENPNYPHGYYTDLMINGGWGHFQSMPSADWQGELRIARQGSIITTYVLSGGSGQWKRIDQFNTGFARPVWLLVAADNSWQATAPSSTTADFTVMSVATGAIADVSQSTITGGTGGSTGATTPVAVTPAAATPAATKAVATTTKAPAAPTTTPAPAKTVAAPTTTPVATDIINTWNTGAAYNSPTSPTVFTIAHPYLITEIFDYHWNGGNGQPGGTIGLRSGSGQLHGPWTATMSSGSGATNVGWTVQPNVVIPAGTYTVVDSSPATWSQNPESGGRGFSEVKGVPRS